jgi:predicted small lipoprotein YifL
VSRSNPSLSKLTALGLIALTCVLAGCGRKAGLDLPPGASAEQQQQSGGATAAELAEQNSAANLQSQVYRPPGTSSIAVAPKGQKKRIPLDAILD